MGGDRGLFSKAQAEFWRVNRSLSDREREGHLGRQNNVCKATKHQEQGTVSCANSAEQLEGRGFVLTSKWSRRRGCRWAQMLSPSHCFWDVGIWLVWSPKRPSRKVNFPMLGVGPGNSCPRAWRSLETPLPAVTPFLRPTCTISLQLPLRWPQLWSSPAQKETDSPYVFQDLWAVTGSWPPFPRLSSHTLGSAWGGL